MTVGHSHRDHPAILAKHLLQILGKLHIRFMIADIDERSPAGLTEHRFKTLEPATRVRFLHLGRHIIVTHYRVEPLIDAMLCQHRANIALRVLRTDTVWNGREGGSELGKPVKK